MIPVFFMFYMFFPPEYLQLQTGSLTRSTGVSTSAETLSQACLLQCFYIFCVHLIILSPFRHIQPNNGFCQQRPQSQLRQTEARLRQSFHSLSISPDISLPVTSCQERPQCFHISPIFSQTNIANM